MRGLLEQSGDELLAWLGEHGQPPLRARQVRRWIVAGRAESFEQMTDLPLALRRDLAAAFVPLAPRSPVIWNRPTTRTSCCCGCTTAS